MGNRPSLVAVLSILALVLVQCQATKVIEPTGPAQVSQASPERAQADIRFVVVTHGQASDPFWSVVRKGVDQAAQDVNVQVEYHAPDTFDMAAMAQLIEEAVASKPDGLVVSIPDADALAPAIKSAVDAGIPVISINSGSEVAEELGVLTHVGQTEYEAGYGAGLRMAAAGVSRALCVNQEVGNQALDLRCDGFADALALADATSDILAVDLTDADGTRERILMALDAIPDVDGVLTLGPTGAVPTLQVLEEEDLLSRIQIATFDLSPQVLEAIRDGKVLFAIDQQQYLQGYLPIVLLKLYNDNANTPASDLIFTGPGFVTRDNVDRVIELSKAGTR